MWGLGFRVWGLRILGAGLEAEFGVAGVGGVDQERVAQQLLHRPPHLMQFSGVEV